MCIIAKSLASQHPSQSLANDSKPAYGSNANNLIACSAPLLPQRRSRTRRTGFFPRQQYYASLTTTHAVTRAFNFEEQKNTRTHA